MAEIILGDVTEVPMEIQNGSNNVGFTVTNPTTMAIMGPTESVVVRTINDYSKLKNKPKINNRFLNAGENTLPYLGKDSE